MKMPIEHFETENSDMVLDLENLQYGHGGKLDYGYLKIFVYNLIS